MLTIPLSTVAWIILKAREFDAKDIASDASDIEGDEDNPYGVLADRADDPTVQELTSWIGDLNDTERAELVALFWLGRDSGAPGDMRELIAEARRNLDHKTAAYLLDNPMLADHLEEGLSILGYDPASIESDVV